MGEQIWGAMDSSLQKQMAFMDWVQTCSGILAKANKPLIWTSPVGGRCVQSPFKTKSKTIELKINGNRICYKTQTPTNIINKMKMMSSSSPNIIHSCDASHLLYTVDGSNKNGVQDFAMVHDSFGTHPDDTQILLDQAKQSWVNMYNKNWMMVWYEDWCNQLGTNDLPRPDEFVTMGSLKASDVLKSDFFFA